MFRLNLTHDDTDDPRFVDVVEKIVAGCAIAHRPREVRIFQVDRWFDHKWLAFSGKQLGIVGFWAKQLTVPPFVANRIVRQWRYALNEANGAFEFAGPGPNIHHRGRAEENLRRTVQRIAPNAALFWYSGDTAATGRGSLMGYIPADRDHWPWFLAFARNADWRVARRKSIHEYEVRLFQEAANRAMRASEQFAANDRERE